MKKIIVLLLLLGFAVAAYAVKKLDRSAGEDLLLKTTYNVYLRSDKEPNLIIPYLGGKFVCFIYYGEDESGESRTYIPDSAYEEMSTIAEQYGSHPSEDVPGLMEKYSLSANEAAVLRDWAKMYRRLTEEAEVMIVPKDSKDEQALLGRYASAEADLNQKFDSFKSESMRRKAFYAVHLMTGYLTRWIEQDLEAQPGSSESSLIQTVFPAPKIVPISCPLVNGKM